MQHSLSAFLRFGSERFATFHVFTRYQETRHTRHGQHFDDWKQSMLLFLWTNSLHLRKYLMAHQYHIGLISDLATVKSYWTEIFQQSDRLGLYRMLIQIEDWMIRWIGVHSLGYATVISFGYVELRWIMNLKPCLVNSGDTQAISFGSCID